VFDGRARWTSLLRLGHHQSHRPLVYHLGPRLFLSFLVLAGSDSIQNNVVRLPGVFVRSLEMLEYLEEGFFLNMLGHIWLDLLVMPHHVGEAESLLYPG
jgi:hypothetical protein